MWSRAAAAILVVLCVAGCAGTTASTGSGSADASPRGVPSAAPSHAELSTKVRPLTFGQVVGGVPCTNETPIGQHVHVHLRILYDGVEVPVPAGIGIGRPWQVDSTGFILAGSCFAWLHVHDGTGVVHLVSPMHESFTLGQLFAVWGQPLSTGVALDYHGEIVTLVNGERFDGDPAALKLANFQSIVLELGEPPAVPPPSFFNFGATRA